ncbi:hypothetical protein EJB05_15222, partial [Eragrostis curvula]
YRREEDCQLRMNGMDDTQWPFPSSSTFLMDHENMSIVIHVEELAGGQVQELQKLDEGKKSNLRSMSLLLFFLLA